MAAVALVGLGLRVAYVLAVAGTTPRTGDAFENELLADSIAKGRGYTLFTLTGGSTPTAHKPPLYPMLMGLASKLGLESLTAHQMISVVLGTGVVVVAALLARRAAGPRAAVLAAGLAAVYPIFLITDASLRSETLFALLVGVTLLAAYAAAERPTWRRYAGLGALVALASLTRAEGLWLLVVLVAPLAWQAGRGRRIRLGLAALVAFAVVLAPWTIRCWIVFDRPVLISTNSGDLLAGANCDQTYRGPAIGTWRGECTAGGGGGNGAEVSARLARKGLTYAGDHAERLPAVLAARTLRTFGLFEPEQQLSIDATEGRNRRAGEAGRLFAYALIALSIAGLAVLRRRGRSLLVLGAPLALVVLISLSAYGVTRFRIAGDVALVALAAVALDALLGRLAGARARGARPATA